MAVPASYRAPECAVRPRRDGRASGRRRPRVANHRRLQASDPGTDLGPRDNIWLDHFAGTAAREHAILAEGSHEEVGALLRDPVTSMLHYGFDGPTQIEGSTFQDPGSQVRCCLHTYDALLSLAEAANVKRSDNPEAGLPGQGPEVEDVLNALDGAFGFRIDFPNIYRGDMGVQTSRGVMTHRAIMALYQSWRIFQTAGENADARILEIGAGLGRNAYYTAKFGIRRYTIVDLPTTSATQAYFLGRTLGEDAIALFGEERPAPRVRIVPPETFFEETQTYDLVANFDSMSEFSIDTAVRYVAAIFAKAPAFLSVNHENNPFTVRDLALSAGAARSASRAPHWMRRGYVEEVFVSPRP